MHEIENRIFVSESDNAAEIVVPRRWSRSEWNADDDPLVSAGNKCPTFDLWVENAFKALAEI